MCGNVNKSRVSAAAASAAPASAAGRAATPASAAASAASAATHRDVDGNMVECVRGATDYCFGVETCRHILGLYKIERGKALFDFFAYAHYIAIRKNLRKVVGVFFKHKLYTVKLGIQ